MIGLCGGGIHHAQKKEIDFAYQKDLKDPNLKIILNFTVRG